MFECSILCKKITNNVNFFYIAIDVNDDAKICRLLLNALLVLIFWFYNHTNIMNILISLQMSFKISLGNIFCEKNTQRNGGH
jgi:hypothetical protein